MSKRGGKRPGAGRPCVDLPNPIGIRIDNESLDLLNIAKQTFHLSRSHLVNQAIKKYIIRLYGDIVELNE